VVDDTHPTAVPAGVDLPGRGHPGVRRDGDAATDDDESTRRSDGENGMTSTAGEVHARSLDGCGTEDDQHK
jgi:hypothetical protein